VFIDTQTVGLSESGVSLIRNQRCSSLHPVSAAGRGRHLLPAHSREETPGAREFPPVRGS